MYDLNSMKTIIYTKMNQSCSACKKRITTLNEIEKANEADTDNFIDQEMVMQTVIPFYQTCIDHLDQWKAQFEDVKIFD